MLKRIRTGVRLSGFLLLASLVLTPPLGASSTSQEELQARLEKKRASEFLETTAWQLDYDHALAQAQKQKSLVFAYFTRSYEP